MGMDNINANKALPMPNNPKFYLGVDQPYVPEIRCNVGQCLLCLLNVCIGKTIGAIEEYILLPSEVDHEISCGAWRVLLPSHG